jgi:hypothetical protein
MPSGNPPAKRGRPPNTDKQSKDLAETGEQIVKKRGSKSASVEKTTTATKDEIKQILKNSLYWYNREIVKSDEECAERLNEYFARLAETGEIPTVEKMCLALGTVRQTVYDWECGTQGTTRSVMIKKAKEILASLDAELVSKGKIPQITYIFRAKNFFQMSDKQEFTIVPGNPLGTEGNPNEASQKYQQAMPGGPASIMAEGEIE